MPRAQIDQRSIHYVDPGGDAPVVLGVHTALLDHRSFDAVAAALGDAARFIGLDLPGFGDSPAAGPYDGYDLAALLIGLLDHLGVERAVLAAMGMGGLAAIRAALARPDRISGLVLVAVQFEEPDPLTAAGYRVMIEGWGADGPTGDFSAAVAHAIFGDDPARAHVWRVRWATLDPLAGPHAFAALAGADPIRHRLAEIGCPARVLHGARDEAVPREISEQLAARLRGAGPVEVLDGPHCLIETHPAEIAEAICAVLP